MFFTMPSPGFQLPPPRRAARPSWKAALASVLLTLALVLSLTQRLRPNAEDSSSDTVMTWLRIIPSRPIEVPVATPTTMATDRLSRPRPVRRAEAPSTWSIARPLDPSPSEPALPPAALPAELESASATPRGVPDISDMTIRSAVRASAADRSLGERAAADLNLSPPVGSKRLEQDVAAAKKRDCGAPNPEEASIIRGAVILALTALSGRCAGQ